MEGKRKVKTKKVAMIYCQGGHRAKRTVSLEAMEGDCRQAVSDYPEGVLECAWGCIGRGSCVTACRLHAIVINDNGVAEVDRERCVGCGLCVKACPQQLIGLIIPENTIAPCCSNQAAGGVARKQCEVSCIGCRICEKNCPAGAISVIDNCAVIDQERCIACGMCAVKCPRQVIVDADGIFTVHDI